jgi:hypothetical protein
MTGRRIIVTVGMDRSGSSLCSHILHVLGVDLGEELLPAAPDNPTGFWESKEIVRINDAILSELGLLWHSSTFLQPPPVAWWRNTSLAPLREAAMRFLQTSISGCRNWGFKDPRTATLLPFWIDIINRIDAEPTCVFALRNPRSVALSLERRDGIHPAYGELLWIQRTLDIVRYIGPAIAAVVNYEDWFINPVERAQALATVLGITWKGDSGDLEGALTSIIQPDLQHHCGTDSNPILSTTRWLYTHVRTLEGIKKLHGEGYATQLVYLGRDVSKVASRIFHERTAELTSQHEHLLTPLQAELHTFNEIIKERDDEIRALKGHLAEREKELRLVQAQLESARQLIAEPIQFGSEPTREIPMETESINPLREPI